MKTIRFLRSCAVLALIGATTAWADEPTLTTIKFSDPSKPGTIKIALARGELRIQGADTPEVSVKSEAQPEHRPRKDGLRVLTEAASFALTEKDNVVLLDAASDGWTGAPSDFSLTVPRGTNVVVASSYGGDVTCSGLTGDIEIKSVQGEVRLDNVSGAALVETTNGEIVANVRELHDGKSLSFTSMNGGIVLRLPTSAKANVRLRTQNGSILTDFDEKTLVTKVETSVSKGRNRGRGGSLAPEAREAIQEAARATAEAARHASEAIREAVDAVAEGADEDGTARRRAVPPLPPIPPIPPAIPAITGGKLVTGTLNGGGPEINVATMNGDVTLRQSK